MPIRGLTDNIEAGMPRIGKLRKGAKKPSENQIGKDLTYFRFVCEDPQVVAAFEAAYGKEPRVINAFLPFETVADNFPTWMEERGKHSLKHRCDGAVMVLWQDSQGIYQTKPEPCPYADYPDGDKRRKCKEKGTLHIIIPELLSVRWGYIEVRTGSKWDCLELSRNLAEVKNRAHQVSLMKGQAVTMQHIPCILRRAPRMTSCPVDGNRIMQEKWLLTLEIEPGYFQSVLKASRLFALPLNVPQLEAPVLELDYDPGDNGDDIERPETDVFDPDPDLEPAEESQATNGKWPARPWDAETCRAALNKALEKIDPGRKALKTHQKAALIALNKLALGDDEKRHKLTWFLFGTESSKELTAEQCAVITDKWTQVGPPDFEPCPASVEEAEHIFESLGFEEPVEQEELPF